MKKTQFSKDGKHRLQLYRDCSGCSTLFETLSGTCVFIMLNPSTANEKENDPTVTRCVGFARALGCEHLLILNLFTLISSDPEALRTAEFIDRGLSVVYSNRAIDENIVDSVEKPRFIIAGWGAFEKHYGVRPDDVLYRLRDYKIHALAINKDGSPKHPLYCKQINRESDLEVYQNVRCL